jgi:DNA processing protein
MEYRVVEESSPPHCDGIVEVGGERLYYRGRLELLNRPIVAVVGTRRPLQYTRQLTRQITSRLSQLGVAVISGGAEGVDREAHLGAFPNTILVSPSSLDIPYPKSNRELINRIGREGLLLSQYREKFTPRRYTFLNRNRVIISLAQVVIIPEGDIKGGSANSYRWAKELRRPVWTIPHRWEESRLSFKILEEGGEVIWSWKKLEELLRRYSLISPSTPSLFEEGEVTPSHPLSPEERALKELFGE